MDMSDHVRQWGCPYCSQVFPSRNDFKKHLESDKQLIIDLLRQLQQALLPRCQQQRQPTEGSAASEGGSHDDLESSKASHAGETLRCPHSSCETRQAFIRKDHLLRHFKTHVACDVVCECGTHIQIVDQFEKHFPNCQITQGYKAGIACREKGYKQLLGTKKILTQTASHALTEQLKRSPTPSQFEKATKSSSSKDAPSTTVQSLKRKRVSGDLDLLDETLHSTGETSHQESLLEGCNGTSHLRSLDSLDYAYITGNKSEATQAFGNSTPRLCLNDPHLYLNGPRLYSNESNNDPPVAENTVNGNSLTHESNRSGCTGPSETETTGGDWSHFYAGDDTTSQDRWDFGSVDNSANRSSSLFNSVSRDGLDWNSFYNFNNIPAAEVWTGARGKATNT